MSSRASHFFVPMSLNPIKFEAQENPHSHLFLEILKRRVEIGGHPMSGVLGTPRFARPLLFLISRQAGDWFAVAGDGERFAGSQAVHDLAQVGLNILDICGWHVNSKSSNWIIPARPMISSLI